MEAKQTKVLEVAKSRIGSPEYSVWCQNGNFAFSEPKCNLFVADCLRAGGVDVLLNEIDQTTRHFLFHTQWFSVAINKTKLPRPPTAAMWTDPNYDSARFKVVGKGLAGLEKCWPGDIISNGSHVGIVSGVRKVISASAIEGKVVENDWGWRKGECENVVIRRYHP